MAKQGIEIAIANLLSKPELVPENMKSLFRRLSEIQPIMENIERQIAETRKSMNNLIDNRAQAAGALNTILDMIDEQLPVEIIDAYGKEYFKKEAPNA